VRKGRSALLVILPCKSRYLTESKVTMWVTTFFICGILGSAFLWLWSLLYGNPWSTIFPWLRSFLSGEAQGTELWQRATLWQFIVRKGRWFHQTFVSWAWERAWHDQVLRNVALSELYSDAFIHGRSAAFV